MKKKVGRNEPCPCGSGKKFKKCCERKMIGKRFMASQLNAPKTAGLTSLFQNNIQNVTPLSSRKITASLNTGNMPTMNNPKPKPEETKPQETKPEEKPPEKEKPKEES